MHYERASGRRQVRVVAGEGMVTPVRETTVTYRNGTKERLIPGQSRFCPSHELVLQRPELFTLCMSKGDRTNASALFRDALRTAERELTRPPSGASHSRPRRSLRTGREPWRPGRYQLR